MPQFDAGSIAYKIQGDISNLKAKLKEADGDINKLSKSLSQNLSRAGKVAGVAIAAAFTGSAIAAAQFEKSISNIATLGLPTEEVEGLSEGIKELVKNSPQNANDLGAAAYDIVSAGISGTADQLATLDAAQRLATAGLGDTKGATDLITSSINSFGLEASQANKVADTLFKGVQNGKTTVDQLTQGFGKVAPGAAAAGVSFEDLISATSALTTTGLPAADAYTQLRGVFTELQKPSANLLKVLGKDGLAAVNKTISEDGFGAGLEQIKKAAEDAGVPLAQAFSSVEAYNAVLGLTGPVAESFAKTQDSIANGSDAVTDAFEKQKETTAGQFQVLSNNIQVLAINIGEKLLPVINKIITFFLENREVALAFGIAIGVLAVALVGLAVAAKLAGISAALAGAGFTIGLAPLLLIPLAIAAIVAAFFIFQDQITAVFNYVRDFITNNWETIVIVLTGGIGALVILVVKNFDTIKNFIVNTFNTIKNFIQNNWQTILAVMLGLLPLLVFAVVKNFDKIKSFISNTLTTVKNIVVNKWQEVVAVTRNKINSVKNTVTSGFQSAVNTVSSKMNAFGGVVSSGIGRVLQFFRDFPAKMVASLGNTGELLLQAGKDIINGLLNGINNAKDAVLNKIGEIGGSIKDKFANVLSIFSPSRVFEGFGENIVQGLVDGLENLADTAVRTVADLATSVSDQDFNVSPTITPTIGGIGALPQVSTPAINAGAGSNIGNQSGETNVIVVTNDFFNVLTEDQKRTIGEEIFEALQDDLDSLGALNA